MSVYASEVVEMLDKGWSIAITSYNNGQEATIDMYRPEVEVSNIPNSQFNSSTINQIQYGFVCDVKHPRLHFVFE